MYIQMCVKAYFLPFSALFALFVFYFLIIMAFGRLHLRAIIAGEGLVELIENKNQGNYAAQIG